MPRGNYWEMTYDPKWDGPSENAYLTQLSGSSGFSDRKVIPDPQKPLKLKWRVKDPSLLFQRCDFALTVTDAQISNWSFKLCRFAGSVWKNVKFSHCTFEQCDFSNVIFDDCNFVDSCTFKQNSASAELFRMEETAINAGKFITNLETNLEHVDADSKLFQTSRFVGTRANISKVVFGANRNEANIDYYFRAYEQLVRCDLDHQIERRRFDDTTGKPIKWFWLRTLPFRFEKLITLTSGWLTNWGRSLVRPSVFFAATVLAFAVLYWMWQVPHQYQGWKRAVAALTEATNLTLVAGYTAHFDKCASLRMQLLWMSNMAIGLYWYSLIIPVITRRVMR